MGGFKEAYALGRNGRHTGSIQSRTRAAKISYTCMAALSPRIVEPVLTQRRDTPFRCPSFLLYEWGCLTLALGRRAPAQAV